MVIFTNRHLKVLKHQSGFGLWLVISDYNTISLKCLLGFVFTMFKMSLLRSTLYINLSLLLDVQQLSLKPQVLSLHYLGYGSNDSFSFAFCSWPGCVEMKALHCQKHKNMQSWGPFTHSTMSLSPKWTGRLEPFTKGSWGLAASACGAFETSQDRVPSLRPKAPLSNS